jgi:hypothetical protein
VLVGLACLAACGPEPPAEQERPVAADDVLGNLELVAPEDVGRWEDLPGIAGFEDLDADLRAQVVARANRTACACRCFGRSVNACLHQTEQCETAIRLATAFVDDALAFQLHRETLGRPAPAPADEARAGEERSETADGPGEPVAQGESKP